MSIELKHITKTYKTPVIKDLSFTFENGKIYLIKGVSGCGKTTLLNIIGGIDKDFEGELSASGTKNAYIFQQSLLVSGITLSQNLSLIKNDPEKIGSLSEELGIAHLLDRTPESLSGGERQRASIVRALLCDPDIILADEPTSSLDETNSENTAGIIASLRNENRVIIIATHGNCFDKYADCVIDLDYGEIKKVTTNSPAPAPAMQTKERAPAKKERFLYYRYTKRRKPRFLLSGGVILLTVVFLSVMILSSVQNNFKSEYLRSVTGSFPLDMVIFSGSELENFEYKEKVKIYAQYVAEDGIYHAFHLYPENDSVFGIKGMIESGAFPKSENEILATKEFLSSYFNAESASEEYIGKEIVFMGEQYTVSGVTASDLRSGEYGKYIAYDPNYTEFRRTKDPCAIFMLYERLSKIGEPQDSNSNTVGFIDGFHNDVKMMKAYERAAQGNPNPFYGMVEEIEEKVDNTAKVFTAVLLSLYAVFLIFLLTLITTELYYRRKELGYLQIFGMSKSKILGLILSEHIIKLSFSFAAAVIVYFTAASIYAIVYGVFPLFGIGYTVIAFVSLIGMYLLTVFAGSEAFLKKSVLILINVY